MINKTGEIFLWSFTLLLLLPASLLSQTIGIGTVLAPRAKLEVQGVGNVGGSTSGLLGGDGAGISLQRNPATVGFNQYANPYSRYMANGYATIQYLDPADGSLSIGVQGSGTANNTNTYIQGALQISNSGNLAIFTNAINATLYSIKALNPEGSVAFLGTDYNSYFDYSTSEHIYIRTGKLGGNVYINDGPSGHIIMGRGDTRVGINTPNPSFSLDIRQLHQSGILLTEPSQNNNRWEQALGSYGGGPQSSYNFFYNGQLKSYFRPTDGVQILTSDGRVKENITAISSVLDKILRLNPVTYEMKYRNPQHKVSYGFIAQEVKAIFPEMVTVSSMEVEKGITISDFNGLNYDSFKVIAVKGVQEEQLLLEQQQQLQNEIIKRLEAIEQKLRLKKLSQ